jgi:P-type E1-E2 ATPase
MVCIVGLKDEMQEGACEMMDAMKKKGIHCWLLSGDSRESTLNVGKRLSQTEF